MAMTMERLKSKLSAIEQDESIYEGIGGTEIFLLEDLLNHPEPWMAARAVFSLARIKDERTVSILQKVARDRRPEVRLAVASSAQILPPGVADGLLNQLLDDPDIGVKKFAIRSVSNDSAMDLRGKLVWMAKKDQSGFIRAKARERLLNLDPGVFIEFDPAGRDIDSEYIMFRNNARHDIDIKDWIVSDHAGHKMTLPSLTLSPGAEVKIWTKIGHNDAANIYWGRKQAIWNNSGDTIRLCDAQKKELCGFRYP
jgi:hypothetical protein